jgi:hypothetical protein
LLYFVALKTPFAMSTSFAKQIQVGTPIVKSSL